MFDIRWIIRIQRTTKYQTYLTACSRSVGRTPPGGHCRRHYYNSYNNVRGNKDSIKRIIDNITPEILPLLLAGLPRHDCDSLMNTAIRQTLHEKSSSREKCKKPFSLVVYNLSTVPPFKKYPMLSYVK